MRGMFRTARRRTFRIAATVGLWLCASVPFAQESAEARPPREGAEEAAGQEADPAEAPDAEPPVPALTPEAVLAEFDSRTSRNVWPGFRSGEIPIAIFDGEDTWLARHPAPPEDFAAAEGAAGLLVHEGRHPDLRADGPIELAGRWTAALLAHEEGATLEGLTGTLIRAAFHVYQEQEESLVVPDHHQLCDYPTEDADALTGRRLELAALRHAVVSKLEDDAAAWARRAIGIREKRYETLSKQALIYERQLEEYEGLARYTEVRSMRQSPRDLVPEKGFAPDAVLDRAAVTGAVFAILLDRFDRGWKTTWADSSASLEERLTERLEGSSNAVVHALTPGERVAIVDAAVLDAAYHRVALEDERDEYLGKSGWTLRINAETQKLLPQFFDPLHVKRMRHGEVMHSRRLVLENELGTVSIEGRKVLTQTSAKRTLADGVERVILTGFRKRPETSEEDGVVTITAPGLELTFRDAELREGEELLVLEF